MSDRVVMNIVVSGNMRTIEAIPAILLDDSNAVSSIASHLDGIPEYRDIPRVLDQDLRAPHPPGARHRIVANDVVSDCGRIADFVLNPGAGITLDEVVLIERVDAVDIAPKAGADI